MAHSRLLLLQSLLALALAGSVMTNPVLADPPSATGPEGGGGSTGNPPVFPPPDEPPTEDCPFNQLINPATGLCEECEFFKFTLMANPSLAPLDPNWDYRDQYIHVRNGFAGPAYELLKTYLLWREADCERLHQMRLAGGITYLTVNECVDQAAATITPLGTQASGQHCFHSLAGDKGYGACARYALLDEIHAAITGPILPNWAQGMYENLPQWSRGLYSIPGFDVDTVTLSANHFYFGIDSNGNQIITQFEPDAFVCEAAVSMTFCSPISLIWDEHDFAAAHAKPAKFALDPKFQDGWSTWRASKKAPLLVTYPKEGEAITSAAQLFGTWAFGGKKGDNTIAWKDGYEALATLDKNADEKISGIELDSLGLWFDGNQDGVSTPEELKTLHQSGVTALFYTNTNVAPNGDITAPRGFQRQTIDGYVKNGRSVDWHGISAKTQEEIVSSLKATKNAKLTRDLPKVTQGERMASLASDGAGKSLEGMWEYTIKGAKNPMGFLVFTNDPREGIKGLSFSFRETKNPDPKKQLLLTVANLLGKPNSDGTVVNLFAGGAEGSFVNSEIKIGKNKITGKSFATFASAKENQPITYEWTAKRLK